MLCALLRFAPFSPARTLHHARHSRRSTYARHTVRDQIHRISPRKRRQDDVAPRGCAEEDDAIQVSDTDKELLGTTGVGTKK
jgi:hypothetical protein